MTAFIPILRSSFLFLSRQSWLRRWMETSSAAQRFTSRFIAGLHLEDAIEAAAKSNADGMLVSLDYLGENVRSLEEAAAARDAYLRAIETIKRTRLDSTVSAKVTALGLDLSHEICRNNLSALAAKAQEAGTRVEMDMESAAYTDRTLALVHDMHGRYASVRAVIQAYLYRSEDDIRALNSKRIPVRLCKGAYKESESVAWHGKAEVDANYVKLMKLLLDEGEYPALATHDDKIIQEALAYVRHRGIRPEKFEFQMLYGVRRELHRQLRDEGWRVRLYIPYGSAWYPYFMRRLAERPANAFLILRNLLR